MTTLAEDRAALAAEERQTREERAKLQFSRKYPQYAYDAALDLLIAHHHGQEASLESLEESLGYLQSRGEIQAKSETELEAADQKARSGLIEELTKRMKSILSPDMLAAEQKKWLFMNRSELQVKLDETIRREKMKSLTPAQLRQVIRSERSSGFPKLPDEITAESIRKADALTLRQWGRVYGQQQLNERLGVVPRPPVGTVWSR